MIFPYVSGKISFEFYIHTNTKFYFRWKPLSYIHNVKGTYWKLVLGFGNMDSNNEILDNGIMFSWYESGPWVSFKFPGNPSFAWVGGGSELPELMVWCH